MYKKIGQGGREGIERQARNGGKARRSDNEIVGNGGYETTTGTTAEHPEWTEDQKNDYGDNMDNEGYQEGREEEEE